MAKNKSMDTPLFARFEFSSWVFNTKDLCRFCARYCFKKVNEKIFRALFVRSI
ncbi:hypothetical protein SAMN05444412_101389 [Rhodonellum ikkaensis]|uniref:Uncharacterized protein n=1 Tax=Rhodonellum ikkaensis TaxID=336829 RepID=A0A1H3KHB6_9BACT|nr:hypothetical protein SAMN05444412_101389 [Rhodonellum ikkaensis]